MKKSKMLKKYKAQKAVEVLSERIDNIGSVQEWADLAGCSRNSLLSVIKFTFNKSPRMIIREIRYEMIISCLEKDLEKTGFEIAIDCGLKDEIALSKFLRRHYNINLTLLREQVILSEDLLTENRSINNVKR